jgi:hypothetical protein
MFTIVQFATDFESSVYIDEAARLLFSYHCTNSFRNVSENLEQIAADSSSYYRFRIVMSLNVKRVKCEQSEKFKCWH